MCALLFAAIFAQLLRKRISKILTNAAEIACQGTVYLRAKSCRCAAVALRNAPAGAVTVPCNLTISTLFRENARRSARFYALRAASGADGSLRPQARFGAQPPHSGGS